MLNIRQVNDKYYLSGGWQNLDIREFGTDPQLLKDLSIEAVLDLQYTVNDSPGLWKTVKEALTEFDIDYEVYPFGDWEEYSSAFLKESFQEMHQILEEFEQRYNKRNQHILIKCDAGVSRSPSALLYHLCVKNATSYLEELGNLRDSEEGLTQFGASPNIGFATFLTKKFPYDWPVSE